MDTSAAVIEAMILRWSESPSGRTVTFLLPDDGTQHPFKGLKTGPSYGQRVALSVALISDNETQTPAPEPKPKPAKERRSWSELSLAAQSAIRCGEEDFATFMSGVGALGAGVGVADKVRQYCGVSTRKLLDTVPEAAMRWKQLDADYRFWLQHRENT